MIAVIREEYVGLNTGVNKNTAKEINPTTIDTVAGITRPHLNTHRTSNVR